MTDTYASLEYDATANEDRKIIERVAGLADRYGVTMTEVSLAWLLTKVTAPIVGATKGPHIEGTAKSVDLHLTVADVTYLEELYIPHKLTGIMA